MPITIDDIPESETDEFEFKSSSTRDSELKKKLSAAASGFSNSGGGYFVVGLDDDGVIDGGVSDMVGRQSRDDWIDTVVHKVEPAPKYEITKITDVGTRGRLENDCHLLVVKFHDSENAPHMNDDYRYYIRAGAHTVSARNFIVEALWAKRNIGKPNLAHLIRLKPNEPNVVQLGVVAATVDAAVNVKVNLNPLSSSLSGAAEFFPLKITLLDRSNPLFIDLMTWSNVGEDPATETQITIEYEDISGNEYKYESTVNVPQSVGPVQLTVDKPTMLTKSIDKVATAIGKIK